jgi:hypothetical protein
MPSRPTNAGPLASVASVAFPDSISSPSGDLTRHAVSYNLAHERRRRLVQAQSSGNTAATAEAETLSVRLPLDFIKALIAAASAENVTLSHHVRNILEKSTAAKSVA